MQSGSHIRNLLPCVSTLDDFGKEERPGPDCLLAVGEHRNHFRADSILAVREQSLPDSSDSILFPGGAWDPENRNLKLITDKPAQGLAFCLASDGYIKKAIL